MSFLSAACDQLYWVLVKGLNLSYQNKETLLFTMDPYHGDLNSAP